MNNSDAFVPHAKTTYRLLKLKNGSVAFSASPKGSRVTMEGVEEEVELEVEKQEWDEMRTKARKDKADFATLKRTHSRQKPKDKPDTNNPTDTIKE